MKIEKRVNLYAFEVEYIDQREAKPRTVRRETVVLDGGRVSALERLGQSRKAGFASSTPGRASPWAQSTRAIT